MLKFPKELEEFNHYSQKFFSSNDASTIYGRIWEPLKRDIDLKQMNMRTKALAINYIFSGNVTYIDEKGNNYKLKPGDLLFRHPLTRHSIIRVPKEEEKGIEFFLRIPTEIYEHLVGLGTIDPDEMLINIGVDQFLLDKFISFIDKLGSYSPGELPLLNIELMNLIYDLRMRKEKTEREDHNLEKINQSCKYLSENLEERINIPNCAKKLGMGYQNFRKTFTKVIGLSPKEYRIRRRIEAAGEMIELSDMSLKEIAATLGYSSFANFALQFKKYTGTTPGGMRKMKSNG